MTPRQLMTLAQAAARLGVAPGTLGVQVRRGKLRATKPGHDWLVEEREVERYAREHRRVSAEQAGAAAETQTP